MLPAAVWQTHLGSSLPMGILALGLVVATFGFDNSGAAPTVSAITLKASFSVVTGVAALIAGVAMGVAGNTFAFTLFSLFGTFWLFTGSWMLLSILGGAAGEDFEGALALSYLMWAIATGAFVPAAFRIDLVLCLLIVLSVVSQVLLSIEHLVRSQGGNPKGVTLAIGILSFVAGSLNAVFAVHIMHGYPDFDSCIRACTLH